MPHLEGMEKDSLSPRTIRYLLLLCIVSCQSAISAQDTLWIGYTGFEVQINKSKVMLKDQNLDLATIPHGSDTIIKFNPETQNEFLQIGSNLQSKDTITINVLPQKIDRDAFLKHPLIRINHQGSTYFAYRVFFNYDDQRAFPCIGMNDSYSVNQIKIYHHWYYQHTTLLDFKSILEQNDLVKSNILLTNLAFYSHERKQHLFLNTPLQINF